MKYEIKQTAQFAKWVKSLKDQRAAKMIASRIIRIKAGNLGDIKTVGGGVSELRIFVGKGYRVYFTIRSQEIVILLCGGDKSTQDKNIKLAKQIAKEL